MSDANTREPNLLVIRRGGAAELEAPKGGVWKIAYADFMTAMMAFFLVMWLINATSETTKTGVANYFNPIKLANGTQLPKKGLMDPELEEIEPGPDEAHPAAEDEAEPADAHAAEAEPVEETEHAEEASSEKKARFTEAALFRDPYAVLAAIAAEADATTALVANGGGQGAIGAGAGDRISDTFGDPFDPAAWQVIAAPAEGDVGHGGQGGASLAATDAPGSDAGQDQAEHVDSPGQGAAEATQAAKAADGEAAHKQPPAVDVGGMTDVEAHVAGTGEGPTDGQDHADGEAKAAAGEQAAGEQAAGEADAKAQPLQEQIAKALESGSGQMPSVSVSNAEGGVLISLADQVAFGMFAVGSAEPLPETIAAMEKIAGLLNTLPGKVIIRGHTDGRPFKSGDYDNWRLSSARAHMAYHMLVRGGLDESRVERIEGYADRDLKLPDDPDAAENRRIDILVQEVRS